ncbi:hypothetical protein AB1L88_14690, partial [Tautonia sp. JC769]
RDQDRQWHQAHPHASRKRFADTPSTGAGLPNRAAPDPSPTPAPSHAAPRPADSRNEPSQTAPDAPVDRLNPSSGNEIRHDGSGRSLAADRRTEPRFDTPCSPSDRPIVPDPGRPMAPDGPRTDPPRP